MPPKSKEKPHGATVVLLDVGSNMKESMEDGRTHFDVAKETADWVFSRKLFSSANERMGIVTYGSETTVNENDYKGVQVHCEDLVNANFDHLRFITKEIELSANYCGNVFHGLTVSIDLLAKHQNEHGSLVNDFTIVLITNGMNENIRKEELELLEEKLTELQVDLIVIGIGDDESYPACAIKELATTLEGQVYGFHDMLKIVSNFVPNLSDTRNNNKQWEIAPGIRLPVAFTTKSGKTQSGLKFDLVNEFGDKVVRVNQLIIQNDQGESETFAHVPKSALKAVETQIQKNIEFDLVSSKTNTKALKKSDIDSEFDDDGTDFRITVSKKNDDVTNYSTKELDKSDVCSGYYFGKTLIFFDDDEVKTQYNNHNFNEGETGGCLKLIQFTKRCNINAGYFLGDKCYTVLPAVKKAMNENSLNTTRCTLALIEAMLELDVAAICRYAYHASANLQLMALFGHKDAENGIAYLRAVRLPFIDDMRCLKFPALDRKSDEVFRNLSGSREQVDPEIDTTPTLAHLSAVDDLIDLMQLDQQDTETFVGGGVFDPQLQLQCHYIKNKVLNPGETSDNILQSATSSIEHIFMPKHNTVESNSDLFDRLSREFNLNRIEKQKRQKIGLEKIDMRQIIDDWQTRGKEENEEPEKKKKKESRTRKEELEEEFEKSPQKAAKESCDSSLKTIERMCLFPDNVMRREFFKILHDELETIRDLCIFHLVYECFNDCLVKIRDEEDYRPFADVLGDGKKILPINKDDMFKSPITLEEAEEFWEDNN